MAVDDLTRGRLESKGLWARFVNRRTKLREDGYNPTIAQQMALEQVESCPDEEPPEPEKIKVFNPLKRIFQGKKKATALEEYEWVYNNLIYEEKDLDMNECPSAGALALFRYAKTEDGQVKFHEHWKVMLPTKQQVAEVEKNRDDGRYVLGKIEELQRSRGFVPVGPEGSQGKSRIPEAGDSVG